MSRLRLLVSEAWSSIRMNLSTTVAATMTVLIGMFLLGVFIALGTWVLSWSNHVKRELQVKVYFATDATPSQEAFVGVKLRADSRVKPGGVVYVSKAQAEAKMRKQFPQLYTTPLPSNPLPDSWVVTPKKAADTPEMPEAPEITGALAISGTPVRRHSPGTAARRTIRGAAVRRTRSARGGDVPPPARGNRRGPRRPRSGRRRRRSPRTRRSRRG